MRMKPTKIHSVAPKEFITNHEKQEIPEPTYINELEDTHQQPDINLLLGKHTRKQTDSILVVIDQNYANRKGMRMHKEAYQAFLAMHQAAAKDGIELTIISAYRNFNHQKRIWENKWNGVQQLSDGAIATNIKNPLERATEILRFSAMPGTSRHHWGTDIDINSLNNNYFLNGKGKDEYDWLNRNAPRFGFCQPYTPRDNRELKGYEEEKWHWSYLPVAALYLSTYKDSVDYRHITGFDGWESAQALDVISNYVLAIDLKCLKD